MVLFSFGGRLFQHSANVLRRAGKSNRAESSLCVKRGYDLAMREGHSRQAGRCSQIRGQRQYEARTQSSYGGWDPTTEAGHLRSAGIQVNGSFPCFGSSASRRAVPQ